MFLCFTPREIVFFYRQEFKSKGDFQRRGEEGRRQGREWGKGKKVVWVWQIRFWQLGISRVLVGIIDPLVAVVVGSRQFVGGWMLTDVRGWV